MLSLGQDRRWRRAVRRRRWTPQPGERVLDLAAGTGTSSEPFADAGATSCRATSPSGMLQVGKRAPPRAAFTAADATRLPFADDTFDAVTISFGLRNVVDPDAALREMLRVTRPGGRLVVCEFSHPTWAPFRTVYVEYLMRALPPVARAGQLQPRVLRLPRRVDPGLARPAGARRRDRGRRLDRRRVAQPDRRDRRPAPRRQGRLTGRRRDPGRTGSSAPDRATARRPARRVGDARHRRGLVE